MTATETLENAANLAAELGQAEQWERLTVQLRALKIAERHEFLNSDRYLYAAR